MGRFTPVYCQRCGGELDREVGSEKRFVELGDAFDVLGSWLICDGCGELLGLFMEGPLRYQLRRVDASSEREGGREGVGTRRDAGISDHAAFEGDAIAGSSRFSESPEGKGSQVENGGDHVRGRDERGIRMRLGKQPDQLPGVTESRADSSDRGKSFEPDS